jgi:hypothetical protein
LPCTESHYRVKAGLAGPEPVPFDQEVENALSGFEDVLKMLLLHPETVEELEIPAKRHQLQTAQPLTRMLPYVGNLTILDRAKVTNWFHQRIACGVNKNPSTWIGLLPLAHTFTLLLMHRLADALRQHPDFPATASNQDQRLFILDKCWKYQVEESTGNAWLEVDVDKECLEQVEEQMFEHSKRAGAAGNSQWGQDIGSHQDDWNPYHDLPDSWNLGDRPGHESELEVSVALHALSYYHPQNGSRLKQGPMFDIIPTRSRRIQSPPRQRIKPVQPPHERNLRLRRKVGDLRQ